VTNPPGDYSTARGGYPPPNQPLPNQPPPGPPGQGPPAGAPFPGNYPQPDRPGGYPPPGPDQGGYQPGPPGEGEPPGDAAGDGAPDATDAQRRHPAAGFDDRGKVRQGRISALWVGLVAVAVVLILLIIFIGQNLDKATIHFLGFSGSLPVGLVALVSAVIGVLIAAVPGTVRILQLRKALKKNTPKEQRLP
jgi:uncharacterized integral membrane protein